MIQITFQLGDQNKNNDESLIYLQICYAGEAYQPWERHADFSPLPINRFTHDRALLKEKVDFSMMWDSNQAN